MVKIRHSDIFGTSEIEFGDEPVWRMGDPRLPIFEKYIHTNQCSDEGGWFAFFSLPDGTDEGYMAGWDFRANGCETEEEAVRELITRALEAMKATPPSS